MAYPSDIILRGTLAARPLASIAGRLYFVIDSSTLTRDNGAGWDSVEAGPGAIPDATVAAPGVVEIDAAPATGHPIAVTTPRIGAASGVASLDAGTKLPLAQLPAHEATHLAGGADPIDWAGHIHLAGTHAARPAAGASNAGTLYYETDTTDLFRSDGAAWTQIAYSLAVENAHLFLAGPTSGAAAVPAFRALVDADLPYAIAHKTANYAMVAGDQNIIVDAAGLTITLPAANLCMPGKPYRIKNGPSGQSTVVASAGGTIDNATTYNNLAGPGQGATIIPDGTNWEVF